MRCTLRCAWRVMWLALAGSAFGADAPVPTEFAWRATLELPAGASVVRASLPAQALQHLQSADARDVRVFNAGGEAVAFAISRPPAGPAPALRKTQNSPAFGLFAYAPGTAPGAGAVQVRIEEPAGQRTVWVRLEGGNKVADSAGAAVAVQAAIFATRSEKQALGAIDVQASLPANVPVQVTVATSPDLAQWSPVAVRGRLYRFEGSAAPANMTLEFEQPLQLEGRYLRLAWYGQEGVQVQALSGTVAQTVAPVARARMALPTPTQSARDTLDWALPFATPLAALSLASTRANTLVPVRIQGRVDAAQPWRELAQTVVYRLGSGEAVVTNPPVLLNGASVRQLRVVATQGTELAGTTLLVSAEFEPVQVVFLASGAAPYTLAAGRANTAAAALSSAMVASVLPGKLEDLPLARVASMVQSSPGSAGGGTWLGALGAGVGGRSAVLWAVLVAGVLVLAGVAFALLRQLKGASAASAAADKPNPGPP